MKTRDKVTVAIGALAIFSMVLVPPWIPNKEYAPIFSAPDAANIIDFDRLVLQCFLVALFVGAVLILSKSGQSQVNRQSLDGQNDVTGSTPVPLWRSLDSITFFTIAAFFITVICVLTWHQHETLVKNLSLKEAELKEVSTVADQKRIHAESIRVSILKAAQRTHNEAIEQAEQQRVLMERAQLSALVQSRNDEVLRELAAGKNWPSLQTNVHSVRATLRTYWRDDVMYWQVLMVGTTEDLEIACARSRKYSVLLKNRDALPVFSFTVAGSDLRTSQNQAQFASSVTDNNFEPCSLTKYSELNRWELTLEQ